MRKKKMPRLLGAFLVLATLFTPWHAADAAMLEMFAKGSASKNYLDANHYTLTLSGTAGFGVTLFPMVRLEARYTASGSLQNRLDIVSASVNAILTDIKTETTMYSLGLDIDILGDKYMVQPFVFVGGGYVVSTRSYYVQLDASSPATFITEPTNNSISGNLGAGFRIRIAKSVAFEIEAFAYGMDFKNPNPLVNLYGTVGVRIFM